MKDSSNTIVTYLEPRDKLKFDNGGKRIQVLGLQVNSNTVYGIDNALRQRNFMMAYGVFILGFSSLVMGLFEFKVYLIMKKKNYTQ